MRRFWIALALCFLTATPALAQAPFNQTMGNAVFAYARARYFRDMTRARHCELLDQKQFEQANARFEAVRQALIARFGEAPFPEEDPHPAPVRPDACDPATLGSYAMHVGEVEQAAKAP